MNKGPSKKDVRQKLGLLILDNIFRGVQEFVKSSINLRWMIGRTTATKLTEVMRSVGEMVMSIVLEMTKQSTSIAWSQVMCCVLKHQLPYRIKFRPTKLPKILSAENLFRRKFVHQNFVRLG